MLDIDLIQEKPALTTEFRVSLAADIISTMSIVVDAPSIEGLDQWVYTTHSALSDDMRADMALVLILGTKSHVYHAWLTDLESDAEAHHDFSAFVAWLNSFSAEDYQQLAESFLEMLNTHCEVEELPEIENDVDAIRACYGDTLDEPQIERLIQLYRSPSELKAQLISVMTRFWERFYRDDWDRCRPMAERSAAYHQAQTYGAELTTVFVNVTGRRFPKDVEKVEAVEHVIFVPSCHIGPYVMLSPCDPEGTVLMIHYNGRPTSTPEMEETPAIQDLFPPIKALADETRLQILSLLDGRELYAQEIVDQLDISQSAVSRHLKLMVTGGILDVRKEESMKYFSINESTLADLAEGLRRFRTP
jgi:DNA-binding transcriptional ArsR family regulator